MSFEKSSERNSGSNFGEAEVLDIGGKRREFLAILSTGATSSLAGCGSFLGGLGDDEGTSTPAPRPPTKQSTISTIRTEHSKYVQEIGFNANVADFSYEPVRIIEDGVVQFIAIPLESGSGDRVLINSPDDGQEESKLIKALLAAYGAPVESKFNTSTVFDQEVTFKGGAGVETLAAGGVANHHELGKIGLLARGNATEGLETAIESFDDLKL